MLTARLLSQPMKTIAFVGVDHYRIPLPVVLSDSTHGDIAEFELVTVRVRDAAGVEGLVAYDLSVCIL